MKFYPDYDSFAAKHRAGAPQVVWTDIVADIETAVSLMLKLSAAGTNSFMLESVTGGEVRGRYSVIGMEPDLIWRARASRAEINRDVASDPTAFVPLDDDTLASLRGLIAECRIDLPAQLPPMAAGLFGYLGYDMIRLVEKLPEPNPDPLGLPDAMMMRPTLIAIVDNIKDQVSLVTPIWDTGTEPKEAYGQAVMRLETALARLDKPAGWGSIVPVATAPLRALEPVSNTDHASYLDMVERAKEYIRAGDIFQVVPSQRWAIPLDVSPFALYRALRRTNPSPYMFYFNMGGFQIVGASPEILVRVRDGKVTIRPIAGTRPRGATPEEDSRLEADLMADPKERAEHLMLLDLGRNDVGRVAKIGTVDPNEQFTVEYYS
ncbi:MAG: chorismate-binding protein, partial [Pseudomonadota bacterium]